MSARPITWTVHPARTRPLAALLAVVAVAFVAVLAGRSMGASLEWTSWLFGFLIFASVSSFFFPTTYELESDALTIRRLWTTRRKTFGDIRRVQVDASIALLSGSARPSWVDRYRTLVVPLVGAPEAAREKLRTLAQRNLAKAADA